MDFDDIPFAFYVRVWKGDRAVTALSAEARGIWFELLCNMHELDHLGVITGTREVLARDGRCSDRQLEAALAEIKLHNVAEVTERHGLVTVVNRRMKRQAGVRESARFRQRRARCHADVTPNVTPNVTALFNGVSPVPPSDKERQSDKALSALSACSIKGVPRGGGFKVLADRMEESLGVQWVNDAGKWINRLKLNMGKFERVVAEVESASREGRIKSSPAQYAEKIWKEFR